MWSKKKIKKHREAAQKLGLIKDEMVGFLQTSKGVTETDALIFVEKAYKRHGLVNDHKKEFAIVAFGKNTSQVHYFPKALPRRQAGKGQKLKANNLILIDIWARLPKRNAPYADMTWMFYKGEGGKSKVEGRIPKKIQEKWRILTYSRTSTLRYLEKCLRKGKLPRGVGLDRTAHDVIGKAGYGSAIKHTIGHSLGFGHPHGKLPGINWKEYSPLQKNVGYTIEPGMYFKDFGMRTEIDFYISSKNKIVITTPVQKDIDII